MMRQKSKKTKSIVLAAGTSIRLQAALLAQLIAHTEAFA